FFFSSRRRHTRSKRDWSSDVCSSDLAIASRISTAQLEPVRVEERRDWFRAHSPQQYPLWVMQADNAIAGWLSFREFLPRQAYRRSEERRVGKECRSREWTSHRKKIEE